MKDKVMELIVFHSILIRFMTMDIKIRDFLNRIFDELDHRVALWKWVYYVEGTLQVILGLAFLIFPDSNEITNVTIEIFGTQWTGIIFIFAGGFMLRWKTPTWTLAVSLWRYGFTVQVINNFILLPVPNIFGVIMWFFLIPYHTIFLYVSERGLRL